jgi:hypothetical protein
MAHHTLITLPHGEFDTLLLTLRELENRCIEIEDQLMVDALYQVRLSLIHHADCTGAISSHNPTLD